MDRLRRFFRADRNHLSHVHLKTGSVTQDLFRHAEYQRIHHQLAGGLRSCDQTTCTPRAASLESVPTGWGFLDPGAKFGPDPIIISAEARRSITTAPLPSIAAKTSSQRASGPMCGILIARPS